MNFKKHKTVSQDRNFCSRTSLELTVFLIEALNEVWPLSVHEMPSDQKGVSAENTEK